MTFPEYSGHQSRKAHNGALENFSSAWLCSFGRHETTELAIESFVQNETKAGLFSSRWWIALNFVLTASRLFKNNYSTGALDMRW